MNLLSRRHLRPFLVAGLCGVATVACGSTPEGSTDDLTTDDGLDGMSDDFGSEDDGSSTGDGSASGGSGKDGLDPNGDCRSIGLAEGCSGEVFEGEAAALDLLLVFDESGSMSTQVDEKTGETRLDIVRGALDSFLRDPDSTGIGAALSYFGHLPLGETSCDATDYQKLAVPFGILPDHADDLLDSLQTQMPTGETPTGAAIRAACELAVEHRKDAEGAVTSILLVTDGEPKAPLSAPECDPTLDDAVEAAKTCSDETGLAIYVLGVGPSLTNLNQIAKAGGTETAYLAELDNRDQVLDALQRIRISAQIPCGFELAPSISGAELDYQASTVAYVEADCTHAGITRTEGPEGCDEEARGYYFDNPEAPTRIDLCPATCSEVRAQGQQLFYSIGCPLEVDVYK